MPIRLRQIIALVSPSLSLLVVIHVIVILVITVNTTTSMTTTEYIAHWYMY